MRRAGRWRGSNQLFERDLGVDQQFGRDPPHAAFEQFAPLDVILHHIDAIKRDLRCSHTCKSGYSE